MNLDLHSTGNPTRQGLGQIKKSRSHSLACASLCSLRRLMWDYFFRSRLLFHVEIIYHWSRDQRGRKHAQEIAPHNVSTNINTLVREFRFKIYADSKANTPNGTTQYHAIEDFRESYCNFNSFIFILKIRLEGWMRGQYPDADVLFPTSITHFNIAYTFYRPVGGIKPFRVYTYKLVICSLINSRGKSLLRIRTRSSAAWQSTAPSSPVGLRNSEGNYELVWGSTPNATINSLICRRARTTLEQDRRTFGDFQIPVTADGTVYDSGFGLAGPQTLPKCGDNLLTKLSWNRAITVMRSNSPYLTISQPPMRLTIDFVEFEIVPHLRYNPRLREKCGSVKHFRQPVGIASV